MLDIRVTGYDDPDAVRMTKQVQREYVERYGDEDATPTDPREFAPPHGLFLVGYLDGAAVAMGGWRAREPDDEVLLPGDVEIKRMYVDRSARGRGLSRILLAELERSAAAAGHRRIVLETGTMQPEAISLYTSCGYTPMTAFGIHAGDPYSRCFSRSLENRETAGGEVAHGSRYDPSV